MNCHLLREGFRTSEIVSITNFVVVSSVGIMRVDYILESHFCLALYTEEVNL